MLIECKRCGAPLEVPGVGGFVRCSYCGRLSRLKKAKVVEATTPAGWNPPQQWHSPKSNNVLPFRSPPHVVQAWLVVTLSGVPFLIAVPILVALTLAGVLSDPSPPRPASAPPTTQHRSWDGAEPFSCSGEDRIRLTNGTAMINSGAAVIASGHCRLEIRGANISAPIGVRVEDFARVEITGNLQVSEVGIEASGHSHVTLSGSIFPFDADRDGPSPRVGIRLSDAAEVVIQRGSVTAVTGAELDGESRLRTRYTEFWVAGDGVVARGRSEVHFLRPRIHASGVGVRLLDEAHGDSGDGGSIEGSPVGVAGNGFTPDPMTRVVDAQPDSL